MTGFKKPVAYRVIQKIASCIVVIPLERMHAPSGIISTACDLS